MSSCPGCNYQTSEVITTCPGCGASITNPLTAGTDAFSEENNEKIEKGY